MSTLLFRVYLPVLYNMSTVWDVYCNLYMKWDKFSYIKTSLIKMSYSGLIHSQQPLRMDEASDSNQTTAETLVIMKWPAVWERNTVSCKYSLRSYCKLLQMHLQKLLCLPPHWNSSCWSGLSPPIPFIVQTVHLRLNQLCITIRYLYHLKWSPNITAYLMCIAR